MSTNEQHVRSLISQAAADWFVANRAGLTPAQQSTFADWLKTSPLHIEEYLAVSVIARDLREACREEEGSLDELLARARLERGTDAQPLWGRLLAAAQELATPRWRSVAAAAAACAAVSLGLLALWTHSGGAPVATGAGAPVALHFETHHGEQLSHVLADNSVLRLNTDSSVTVRYSKTERLVTLTSGEAVLEVTHTVGRPFRVLAGGAEVVDLGTKFDVRLVPGATAVTVIEGRVAVAALGSGSRATQFVQLSADQQISVSDEKWPAAPVGVDAQRSTAWLHRQIRFEQEPLERVASEFNRYSTKQIEITSPALRSLQISGVFSTDDTEAFIAFLRSLKGVHVVVTERQIRVSQD